jgi:hypothetical protein
MSDKCAAHKFKEFFKSIPVNYPIGIVFLNGVPVEVATFSNLDADTGLAFFVDAEGQITVLDTAQIDGLAFGEAEEPDTEC